MTRLIVDSTCDLLPEARAKVLSVSLPVRFGDAEYAELEHRRFYEMLIESDALPTTSQPSPEAFGQVFRKVAQDGDTAVVLTISAGLSGTYQSACIAAEEFSNRIFVVDGGSAAIGTGILAEYALTCIEQGMEAAELADRLAAMREKVMVVAMVDTLEYLHKGGRISRTVAVAGGLLSIKPVLSISAGQIAMLGKARGSKQGNNLLAQEIGKAGGVDFEKPLLLGYTGLSDAVLQKYIEDSRALWEPLGSRPRYTCIGPVVGTHAGPGAVAVAFFKKG